MQEFKIFKLKKWQRLVLIITAFLLQQLITVAIGQLYYRNANPAIHFIVFLVFAIAAGAIITFCKIPNPKIKHPAKTYFLSLLAVYFIPTVVVMVLTMLLHPANETSTNQAIIQTYYRTIATAVEINLVTLLFAPVLEEFAFRFCIINPINQQHKWRQVTFSTVLFAMVHMFNETVELFNGQVHLNLYVINLADYATMGLLLALLYLKCKNYYFNACIHASYNLVATLLPFLG